MEELQTYLSFHESLTTGTLILFWKYCIETTTLYHYYDNMRKCILSFSTYCKEDREKFVNKLLSDILSLQQDEIAIEIINVYIHSCFSP